MYLTCVNSIAHEIDTVIHESLSLVHIDFIFINVRMIYVLFLYVCGSYFIASSDLCYICNTMALKLFEFEFEFEFT